jgi:thiamine biosynthesis lipoprotein
VTLTGPAPATSDQEADEERVPTETPTPPAGADVEPFGVATWRALGTYVQLVVAGSPNLDAARDLATRMLDDVDRTCSRFRDDSDLTRANRNAGRWARVDPMLVAAVTAALRAADETGGLVDPTLGLSLAAAGYDRDYDAVRSSEGPAAIPIAAVPNAWRQLELDPDGAIKVPAGVALDLGATGKAFASDLISAAIADRIGTGCVLSLGGDVAVGTPQPSGRPAVSGDTRNGASAASDDTADPDDDSVADDAAVPWQVTISETPDDDPVAMVTLPYGGMATSTVLARRWQRGGQVMHHVLDPATGRSIDPIWRTATVAAHTCLAANTASTATLILGAAAEDWLRSRPVSARLVARDGQVRYVGDWTEEAS